MHYWNSCYYWYDSGRMSRSYAISVRTPAYQDVYHSVYGWYDAHETTSQYTWPGMWAYVVYRPSEYAPFVCVCMDYRTRGYSWFACKHILAVLRG